MSEPTPTYNGYNCEYLLEAVRACGFWFHMKRKYLGNFHERADVAHYANWTCKRALGQPCPEEYGPLPRLILAQKGIKDE